MVLPFILAGISVSSGLVGIGKGFRARGRFEQAKALNEKSESSYKVQKRRLETVRLSCQTSLKDLGKQKLEAMDTYMRRFAFSFSRLKDVQLSDVPSMAAYPKTDLQEMQLQTIRFETIDALKMVIASSAAGATAGFVSYGAVGALATTATTGAAIAGLGGIAASNATMAWLGGGALSVGGLGVAGGTWILGSIVGGPVLACGGMVASAKSKEALANAKAQAAQALKLIKQMEMVEAATLLIKSRAEQILHIIDVLLEELGQSLPQLEMIVNRETDWRKLQTDEQQAVAVITALAYLLKQLIDTPLFDSEGNPVDEAQKLIDAAKFRLEDQHA